MNGWRTSCIRVEDDLNHISGSVTIKRSLMWFVHTCESSDLWGGLFTPVDNLPQRSTNLDRPCFQTYNTSMKLQAFRDDVFAASLFTAYVLFESVFTGIIPAFENFITCREIRTDPFVRSISVCMRFACTLPAPPMITRRY